MNKIYKVVWSKVRNAYVVVSELAKRNSKTKSQHTARLSHSLLSLAVVASLSLGLASTVTLPAEAIVAWRQGTTSNADADTFAVGGTAKASGNGAVAVGTATATGEDALAVGTDAAATGVDAIAIGGATAQSNYAIAMGDGAIAGSSYTLGGATQSGVNAVAIGKNAIGYGLNDVIIGANQTAYTPTFAPREDTPDGSGLSDAQGGRVMIGHDNIAYGRAGNSVILGSNNRSNAVHGIAIGQNAYAGQPDGSTLAYENTMSIGTNTRSYSTDAVAIGNNAVAGNTDTSKTSYDGNGLSAVAIGSAAKATSYRNVAIGATSAASDIDAVAIGDAATASAVNTTAVGAGAQATGYGTLAVGNSANASGENAMAVGRTATASGIRSLATGYGAVASGGGAMAIGTTAKGIGNYSLAAGYENTANGASSVSIGYLTTTSGTRSIAIGREAVSGAADTGQDTIAIGHQATTVANTGIAIGKTAKTDASATSAIALGSGAAAGVATSVALGSGSTTTRATDTTSQGWNNQDSTWSGWLSTKGNAGITSGGVWNSSAGVVSIGTDGFAGNTITRKLTGLAAGVYDTDAVNMKQWTNTMLATTGDFQASGSTQYGSDNVPRTATKLLNESLKITGGVDNSVYYQSDFATNPNIGAIISDNTVTLRLNKTLNGLETIYLTNPTTGNRTTVSGNGITIRPSGGTAVSLTGTGLNNGGNKITNVAAGTAGTDGVNVSQLNQAISNISTGSGSTTTVTVDGGTAAGTDGTYTGSNLQLTSTTGTNSTAYDLKLADNVTLGSAADSTAGTTGTDGSVTVNGKDGSSVAINGSDGSIALNTADGSPVTIKAGTAANDVNGNSINRVTVGDATVATLDDGMVYTGDTGSAAVKLNKTVNIVGGETDSTKLATGNNIGVVASQDSENGKLTIQLAKNVDLGSDGSLTTGNTVVNNDGVKVGDTTLATGGLTITDGPSVTTDGIDGGSKQITNVASGSDGADADGNPTYNNLTNGANIGDIKNITDAAKTELTNDGLNFTADSGDAVHRNLGENLNIAGDGNITTTSDATNGKITVGLSNDISIGTAGTEGEDGKITVNGKDGSAVAINGADGTIALNTGDGSPVTIGAGTQVNNLAGNPIDRITVGGATVATLDDGMKYGGDFGTVSNVKLNNQVDVKGEATTEANLTTGNIGVVSSQNGDNGLLTVKLNKDIDLGETGSVTTGNTVINNSGLTITNGPSVTTSGINAGGNKITNVATGTDGTDAVNVDQLTKAIAGVSAGEGSKTNLTVEGGTAAGTDGNYTGSNLQVAEKTETNGSTTYDVKLADNITLGTKADSEAGTEGTDSSITVNGKDGSAVAINGADGTIALNTADGSPVSIAAGSQVNNLGGTAIDRITVGGQTVATMSDGLKFAGDDGQTDTTKVIPKTLNEQLDIIGGADATKLTDNNIGVNNVNGQLKVQLVKDVDLGSTGSLTLGNTVVNNNGVTITPATGDPVSLTGSGLDNGNNVISNVAAGVKGTDAVNVDQLTKAIQDVNAGEGSKTNLTVEGGTAAGTDGNYTGSNLQVTEKTETNGSTTYDVKLADNLTLGSANGSDGTGGVDGSITLNGADGSTGTIAAGPAANDVNGNSIDRITVGGSTVATLDDGMVYTGDTGSAAVKLNKTVNIVGGETDSSKLSSDNNIGIVAAQDGDNGKLTVRLAKDITGLNTVTAGDATIGNQTETTAGGVAETGSYVTGLDNTEWNVSNPDIVTGRAATEDQLKTVSDAVTAVSDGTSENATGGFGLADGSGTTVKQDLGKTITVKGGATDGTATTENPDGTSNITTAVKDGALEVSLNKDLDLGSTGSVTTGNTVINNDGVTVGDTTLATGGLTITNGPSVTTDGIDAGSKQITNVASGSDGTDADGNPTYNNLTNGANIGDIKNITDAAKTELTNEGLNFTADSGDAVHRNLGQTLNIAGDGNITTTADATNGKITVGLSNDLSIGTTGTDGEDGKVAVNGKDGSAVTINGADGSIALNTGSGSPVTIQAGSAVNDVTGTPVNRITVGDQTVATLSDGMKYGGDFGTVSNVKLNNQVDVKGEATTEADLTTGNIGVVSSQNGDNGLLVVKLNKDINLGETGSVTTGNTVINNSGVTIGSGDTTVSLTNGGLNNGGNKITNVAAGTDGTDAVNVTQLEQRLSQITIGESKTTEVTVEGGTAAPTDGTYAGSNLQVNASTTANGSPTYDVKLADNITLGEAADSEAGTTGTDSSITLNGADGSSVAVNGADGSVTAKGTDGSAVAINGSDGSIALNTGSGSPVTIKAGTSADNLAGTSVDRITVGGQTVATMSDGLKYAGDDGQTDTTKVIAKKLNEQLDIVGGADATKLTDGNIGVNNVNGQLKVQLVKDLNLGDTGSVTVGTAVLGNQTVTTANGASQTGTYLTGLENTAWDTANPDAVTGRAATEDQLKAINDKVNSISSGIGAFGLTDDDGTTVTQSLGETIQVAGDGNITTTADATTGKLTVGLSNDLSVGKAGTDGADGKIGVNGKDGAAVVINGADGSIGLTGPAGEDGTPGTTVTIKAGDSVDDVNGNPVDRITAGGETIATMSDGQKYAGDNGQTDDTKVIAKKLNEQLDIVGGADADKLTDNNIGVNNVNGQLKVQLAQNIDLGTDGSVAMGNTVVNNSGMTIGSGDTAVSLTDGGLNNGGNTITNVAAGTNDTDAVNYGQLKAAATAVTVEGGTAAGTTDYNGSNLKLKATTDGDKTTYDLKLADNLTIGSAGENGEAGSNGSIGVNGSDGNVVTIDGNDGISIKGADGKDGVSITGKDGVDGVDGLEGHIGLNGKDGVTDIYTTPGEAGVNGKDGDTMTRIIYTDPEGTNHQVATLDDGMKYTGDTGSAAVKLNKTVNIVGGETDSSKLSTNNNIGIVAEQDGDNGKLTVRLAKDITGLNTVTAGDATIGNQTETTASGVAETGSYVTGLDNTTWNVSNPDIVSGRAATEDQLKTVSDALTDGTSENATGGFGLTDDSGNAVKQDLGKTIQIAGDGQNITTTADAANGKITVALSNDLSIGAKDGADGTDGVDGKIGVNGKDGSSVVINGADGSIGLTGPAGADGTPGTTVNIKVGPSVDDVNGNPVDRITAGGETIATMSDGQKYAGDNGQTDTTKVIAKKLNEQLDIVGGADADKLTDNNIGVNNVNGQLKVQLAQNIDLGTEGSVTMGNTVVNNSGLTITNGPSVTTGGINAGGSKITNVAPGEISDTSTDAVNGSQLNDVKTLAGKHTVVTVEGGTAAGTTNYAGNNLQLKATDNDGQTTYDLKLADNLSVGAKDGADGSIGVNGKDGSSVVINGADGSIGLTGPAGADGTPGTTVTIKAGDSVDDVNGNPVDRITAGGETIATMSDGQKYAGDNGQTDDTKVIAKKLNEQLDIVGGADATKLTDNNIGVNNVNGQLKVQLAQNIDLGTDGSVTMGNTVVNNDGVTITPATGNPVSLTGTGLNNGGNQITNVASGADGVDADGNPTYNTDTNAANIGDLKNVSDALVNKGMDFTADSGDTVHRDLGEALGIVGDGQNITTTTDPTNGNITVALSNDLSIGAKDGADGTDGVDGKIGVNGKDGSSVVINGKDGSIGLTGPAGADGTPGTTVNIKVGPSVDDVNGNPVDRITAGGETIATMSDGQKYAGDNGQTDDTKVIAKKLNEQLDIIGGADADKLTENNIGVNNVNGQLKVQLAQNVDLGTEGSVTTGATVINNDGVTITPATGNPVSLTGTGLDNGGNQITNVASGADGVDADGNPTYNTDTNAANIGDLKNVSDALVNKGMDFTADSGDTVHRDLGEALGIVGDGQNITTTTDPTNGNITVALSNDLSIGAKDGADGTDGVDGKIGVNGKNGSSVVINGADGSIGLTGPAGTDGTPGATVNIKVGPSVDDVTGTPVDRITVGDQTVATLSDGMKYGGDFGDVASVKLNKQVNVKGEATSEDDLTTGNIGVVSSQDDDNALLTVKLNKDINLGSTGSVTTGATVINNDGVTITPTTGNPVTLTGTGLNNGGNKIINVAPGAINEDSMDAVNGSQLNEIRKLAGQHTYVTVEGGTEGGASEYQGKNLLLQAKRDNNLTTYYDLKLSDNITLGNANNDEGTGGVDSSITLNGADGSSVAINGGDGSIALTGANGSTATIAAGTSAPNLAGTAINRITVGGSTVATLDDGMKYGGDFGDTSKVKLNNQVNVKGNAKNKADLTDGNIGVVSSQDGDNGLLVVKLNKDLNLGDNGSVTMGNTLINDSGVTIGSGSSAVTLTSSGLNNGGNQITNVASGTTGKTYDTTVAGQENYNNAANIGDLTTAINDVKNADNGGGFGLTADDGKSVKQDLGSTITVTGDKNIETKVTDDGKLQVGLKDNVDLGQDGSITAGNTTIDKDGVSTDKIAIKDSDISIDKDGINAGNTQIKDVGSGLGNTYDTTVEGQENYNNGANIGDVYNIAKGQAEAVKAQSGKNITVGSDNTVNLNDNITLGSETDPTKQVNIDGNGATVTAGSGDNQVKLDGSKGQVSAGGAVLGNQENTAGDSNPATGTYLTGLDNTSWDGENIQSGRAATEDQLKTVSDKVNKGRVFQGDDGADNSVTVGLGDTLKLTGGADSNRLSDGNIGVVRNSSNDGLDIKLAKNLTGLDSVTTGNTTMNNNGITIKTVDSDRNITIEDSNINMGNNVVSGVADGTVAAGSTEAINGSQLALRDQAINHLGGEVNKLDNRINRVGAGAAALAALHPQDFDPDDKWDFAFGYGHYRGANAGAFGAFYKPNEDTTFSVGGTIGGGENMINAGVSFKLGQGNNVSNSRVGMAKEIKHLRDDVAKLEDIVNRQSQMINQLTGQNPGTIESKGSELFPDVPANHWAYEYVTKLHQLGIIEGYPDGNFDGNRMMTRYEFAAVVYRAIMAGAASNAALQGDDTLDRLANEFSAELKYIRIDTVAKDKDGKPTIQRVRIVRENKQN